MSDEQLIQEYNKEEQLKLENSILDSHNHIDFNQYLSDPISKHDQILDKIQVVSQGLKQMQDYELEMERLFMEREDKLSMQIEEYMHRHKFIQKDRHPPLMPPYLTQEDNPLKNRFVARTPLPGIIQTDNFIKHRIQIIQLPQKIDISKVKILWSKEKEDAETEKQRIEEQKIQKDQEHKRLIDLVAFTTQVKLEIFENQNSKGVSDQLSKFLTLNKAVSKYQQCYVEQKIDIKINIVGKDPKLYSNPDQIYAIHLTNQYHNQSQKLLQIIPSLQKLQPTQKESEDPMPKYIKQQKNEFGDDFMNNNMNTDNSLLSQALELHAPDQNKSDKIEIKNEQLGLLELAPLNSYRNLIQLNLSMNKIAQIKGTIDCPLLTQLRLSDNQIKEIPAQMFAKCHNLKILYLDINQLKKIQNVQYLTNLEELSVSNNQISTIEGIQSLSKLRRLNLSFNKITQLDNSLSNLTFLEYLELGKNFISNIDQFPTHKLLQLTELYLYSNQLVSLPKNFQFAQLKVLNLNRNQDLHQIHFGYCPLLEQLTLSYCSIVQIKQLTGTPCLKEIDISFNSINSLDTFLQTIKYNKQLRNIRFNDNPFSVNKETYFDKLLKSIYPYLERVNGEPVQADNNRDFTSKNPIKLQQQFQNYISLNQQQWMLRQFITKLMSQKIRITFFSTTPLIKYYKNMLPLLLLQQQTQSLGQFNVQQSIMSLFSQNHQYVQKLQKSARVISTFLKFRKIKRKALLKRMAKHQDKILKIQALLKGYYTRVKNQAIVAKIKRDGPKKTKKYQTISKLQANIKGFLFRKRRIRALEKLNNKQNTFDDDMEDFDADNFFNIKQEHLESGLALPQEQMMQQMIQMMATQNTQVRQVPQFKKDDTNGVKFPPIRQQAQTVTSNMNDMIKPKSMIRNNRPPSARSNAISEIDMNSDSQSVKQNQPIRKNNLMQSQNDFANPNPHRLPSISGASNHNLDDSDRQSVYSMNSNPFYPTQGQNNYVQRKQEEKKQQIQKQEQVIEEWGFQNEDTKKMFEARMKKKNQGKKKVLTAEEKLQKFKAMNDQKRK